MNVRRSFLIALLSAALFGSVASAQLTITTTSLPDGTQAVSYNQPIAVTGAVNSGLFWTISAGALPDGLFLDSGGGTIQGTPTTAGIFNFTVQVVQFNDTATPPTASKQLSINVRQFVTITTTSPLPTASLGVLYTAPLAASTPTPTGVSWFLQEGAVLPAGINLDSGGILSGTPTQTGTFTFGITASTFFNDNVLTDQKTFSLTVAPPLSITTSSLPAGVTNSPYNAQLTATGGGGTYQWSLSGSLPAGLSLTAAGQISGVPTSYGSYSVTVVVSSTFNAVTLTARRTFTLQVNIPPLTVTTTGLPSGVPGTAYSLQLAATGGQPSYNWSLSAGTLPAGLTLSQTGLISGTPTAEAVSRLIFQVSDSGFQIASVLLTLTVAYPPITITGTLPSGAVNLAYSAALQATGGSGTYTFAVTGGSFPPGLTLSAGGAVSGTPTATGTYTGTIQVSDTSGKSASTAFSILIKAQLLGLSSQTLPTGTIGVPYSASIGGAGGTAPYSFTGSGLPPGLSLSASGQISGTPTTKGTYTIAVAITDSTGATASGSITLAIVVPALAVSGSAPDGQVGVAVTGKLTVTGGTPPYTCSLATGAPPAGVAFNADCSFSGTPTTLGTSSFTVQASDSAGATVSTALTMRVVAPPIVISPTLAAGTVGAAYSQTLSATGGLGTLTWSSSGGLPDGITLSTTGVVSGTTLSAGTFSFTVTARDTSGTSASRSVGVTFNLPSAPAATFTGLSNTGSPATQPAFQVQLATAYPVALSGTLTLAFAGDDGSNDPAVQFSTGGRTFAFTVAANSTTATFAVPSAALATGTTAGLITLTARLQAAGQDVTPNPVPTQTIRIGALAPVISSVTATRSTTSVTVVVTGYATSKQVTTATFTFNPATGANFQTTSVSVTVSSPFTAYYTSSASSGFGSQFTFTQTFTVSGNPTAIASVGVVLTNSVGSSSAVSATLQ